MVRPIGFAVLFLRVRSSASLLTSVQTNSQRQQFTNTRTRLCLSGQTIDETEQHESVQRHTTRRAWLSSFASVGILSSSTCARADGIDVDEEEYDTSSFLPPGPVERSGLVVLRVAEVAAFQEKIIRSILNKDLVGVIIAPQQIVFGTQILLRNSDIAGNLKMMIDTEIPRDMRKQARSRAAKTMNTIQAISSCAAKVERPFTDIELLEIADLYRDVRLQLNGLYDYLPQDGKDKYYGYFMQVTDYEKKIADGTYNPELDGILQFNE